MLATVAVVEVGQVYGSWSLPVPVPPGLHQHPHGSGRLQEQRQGIFLAPFRSTCRRLLPTVKQLA